MVGTRSSLFWCISEAYGRDQIIPLLGISEAYGRDQIISLLVYLWRLWSGPDHHSSGVSLKPMVGTRLFLFWCIYEAYGWDQINPLLVYLWSLRSGPDHPSSGYLWSLWSGPDHPSSGASLKPMVGTRSFLFWCIYEAYGRDQIIPLLVHLWSLWSGPDHPSSGASTVCLLNCFQLTIKTVFISCMQTVSTYKSVQQEHVVLSDHICPK